MALNKDAAVPATGSHFPSCGALYVAPPGGVIKAGSTMTYSYRCDNLLWYGNFYRATVFPSDAGTWTAFTSAGGAAEGSGQWTVDADCQALLLVVSEDTISGHTAAAKEYFRLTGIRMLGAIHPDTGATLAASEIVADLVVRNLIADFGGGQVLASDERMRSGTTPFTDLVFEKPSTIEDALKRVCDVEGWTWGVFDRKLLSLGPVEHITTAPSRNTPNLHAGTPPWWMTLRAEDHTTDLTRTLQGVVNRVLVPYVDEWGSDKILTVEDFDNPLNPLNKPGYAPRQIRTATVSLGGSTPNYSVALAAANAYLAQYGRPAASGQITLADRSVLDFVWGYDPPTPLQIGGPYGLDVGQLGSEVPQAPPTSRPASAVLPGWWVHIPDGTDAMYDSQSTASSSATRTPPGGLLVIRSVKVDADRGEVTLDIDSGRDAFDRFQARLAAG